MGYYNESEEGRLLSLLRRLERDVAVLQNQVTRIPVLDEDPDAGSAINLWMFTDGRLRGRRADGTVMEYTSITPGSTTSSLPFPTETDDYESFVYAYSSDWQQAYKSGGSTPYNSPAGRVYYGFADDGNGEYMSMIGFSNFSELAPDPGKTTTIERVQLQIDNRHTYLPAGTTLTIGLHSETSAPGSFVEDTAAVAEVEVPSEGVVLVDLPVEVGEAFRYGTATGVTFHQNSTVKSFFGYADAIALKIAYTK